MRIGNTLLTILATLALSAAGCGDDSGTPQRGTEGKACYPNQTCNPGLKCASNICVRAPDSGVVIDQGVKDDQTVTEDQAVTIDQLPTKKDVGTRPDKLIFSDLPPRIDGPVKVDAPTAADSSMTVDSLVLPDAKAAGDTTVGSVGLHGDCTSASATCKTGLVCLWTDAARFRAKCFQECTKNTSICAGNSDGRTTCLNVGKVSYCAQEVATGAACDPGQSKICASGNECKNSKCVKLTVVGHLQPCGGQTGNTCNTATFTCTKIATDFPHGYCLQKCATANAACTTSDSKKGTCIALQGGGNVCSITGTALVDGLCHQDPNKPFDPAKACPANATCITAGQGAVRGICLTTVASCTGGGGCLSGRVCIGLSGGRGACAADCSTKPTICGTGTECSTLANNKKVCTALPPPGNKAYAQPCSAYEPCTTGLTCLRRDANSREGYCTKSCVGNTDCPKIPAGGQCSIPTSPKLCGFPCSSGQGCPAGLRCDATNGVCLR